MIHVLVFSEVFHKSLNILYCVSQVHVRHRNLTLFFSSNKYNISPTYIRNTKVPVSYHFILLESSHINLFFCLKLGNEIFLPSSSSSSRSFNILADEKYNKNLHTTWTHLHVLLHIIYFCEKLLNREWKCILIEHSLINPFSDCSTNINNQMAVNWIVERKLSIFTT